MSSFKNPPVFDDKTSYEDWKQDVDAWTYCTDLTKDRQGPALFLSLSLTVRESVRSLKMADLAKEAGAQLLLDTLDSIYKTDENTRAFLTFKEFYSFRRPSGMSICDFLSRYEFLYNKLIKYKIVLPEGVQCFFLLTASNISEDNEKIARTTCADLTYNAMKETIKKLFGDMHSSEGCTPAIKSEPESVQFVRGYKNKQNRSNFRYNNSNTNSYSSNANNYSSNANNYSSNGNNSYRNSNNRNCNPKDKSGRVLQCFKCGSTTHLANKCPGRNVHLTSHEDKVTEEEIHVTLFNTHSQFNVDSRPLSDCDNASSVKQQSGFYKVSMSDCDNASSVKQQSGFYKVSSNLGDCYNMSNVSKQSAFSNVSSDFDLNEISFSVQTANYKGKLPTLLRETLGMAILDSACSRTVMGQIWYDVYQETMSEADRKSVVRSKSNRKFCFGDGNTVDSLGTVRFPAVIAGNVKVFIEADVVSCYIPLLFSHESCRKAGMILNFRDYEAVMLGKKVKLGRTSSGHYTLNVSRQMINIESESPNVVLHMNSLEECSVEDKKKKALKLHRQFGHASERKLVDLVKKSKKYDDPVFLDCIRKVCQECQTCEKFRRPPLRPAVGLPLGSRFNDCVCMDLKELVHGQSWIILLIDSATRYCAARIIHSKRQDVIIQAVFMCWVSYFGPPNQFLSDNGGEFSNEGYREMNEKLNVVTRTTAAESPFSNGTVERHNLVVYETMKKIVDTENCDSCTALAWAISAMNALSNYYGHSPNELVFGFNVNLGSVLTDHPPALEGSQVSDMVRININARHAAKCAFVEAESSDKIRRALKSKVRTYADTVYVAGMKVYYRRNGYKGWKGPGVVLGSEGKFVLIRHGGAFYRIHPCHLMPVKSQSGTSTQGATMENSTNSQSLVKSNDISLDEPENLDYDSSGINTAVNVEGNDAAVNVEGNDAAVNVEGNGPDERGVQDEEMVEQVDRQPVSMTKPKAGQHVKFKLDNEVKQGTLMMQQPKATGQYCNWRNITLDDGSSQCVNWEHVEGWEIIENDNPVDNEILLSSQYMELDEVKQAKKKEVDNMIANKVFEVVPYTGQKTVSSKWILTDKVKNNNHVIKARIVAKGFEEDTRLMRTDSPTCSRESLRLIWMTGASMNWKVESIDFTAAFLQGDEIKRDVFLKMPADVCPETHVWKLKRCIYGLNDAPRSWFDKVVNTLSNLGGVQSVYDNALFVWHYQNSLIGLMAVHVDDFAVVGNQQFKKEIVLKIKTRLKVGSHETSTFKYLGLQVTQNKDGVKVDQNNYVSGLKEIELPLERSRRKNDEASEEEKKELRRVAGQMLWVATQTRPDMVYDSCRVSNVGKQPNVSTVLEANNSLSKLKAKQGHIFFPNLGNPKYFKIICYSDATYASLPDGSSQGGYIVFVKGANGQLAPICWSSRKLERVTRSPLASEALALNDVADAGFLIGAMLQEVFRLPSLPPVLCKTDNASLVETLHTDNLVQDKRLRIDIARLREMRRRGEIDIQWVKGSEQLSDPLTKSGANPELLRHVLMKFVC